MLVVSVAVFGDVFLSVPEDGIGSGEESGDEDDRPEETERDDDEDEETQASPVRFLSTAHTITDPLL
jgi:hypothetical protein